ncbi:acyltransferase [Puia sp.]|jgi:acetyltransferase-like isoleucine patch superfamily enzyme|uniref:acyltransferase n=1 Tax=Puia sp. TaxID=2045100 RepID=UPI002F42ACF4
MKKGIQILLQAINKLRLAVGRSRVPLRSNTYFLTGVHCEPGNTLEVSGSEFQRSRIEVRGAANTVRIESSALSRAAITITGSNNRLILEPGVNLRSATIHLRGNGCLIHIGGGTTFGGVRIVNAGEANSLTIGKDCLFADHIEIWAGDSHPIYDNADRLINPAEPIRIGDKVWVGSRVIILKGVTIGDGSIVGMGSLVVNDVPAKAISVGNPNRTVKDDYGYWKLHY